MLLPLPWTSFEMNDYWSEDIKSSFPSIVRFSSRKTTTNNCLKVTAIKYLTPQTNLNATSRQQRWERAGSHTDQHCPGRKPSPQTHMQPTPAAHKSAFHTVESSIQVEHQRPWVELYWPAVQWHENLSLLSWNSPGFKKSMKPEVSGNTAESWKCSLPPAILSYIFFFCCKRPIKREQLTGLCALNLSFDPNPTLNCHLWLCHQS